MVLRLLYFMIALFPLFVLADVQEPTYGDLSRQAHREHKILEIERIEMAKATYEFRQAQMKQSMKVLGWQHYSSIIISFLVVILVLSGLYLSYLQFRINTDTDRQPQASQEGQVHTEIQAGKEGVSISSPVIGLIILFMSLGFFYLYIMEVYTLQPISLEVNVAEEKSTAQ